MHVNIFMTILIPSVTPCLFGKKRLVSRLRLGKILPRGYMEFVNKVRGLYISGRAIRTLVELLGESKAVGVKIMKFHKITDDQAPEKFFINPDEWYDLDRFLLGMKDIQEKVGEEKIRQVANATIYHAPLPSFVQDIVSSLRHMDRAYQLNLSRDGIKTMHDDAVASGKHLDVAGRILTERIPGINKIICTSTTCFPTFYELGLIEGFARKFQSNAVVTVDKTKPMKKYSADSNTFVVIW